MFCLGCGDDVDERSNDRRSLKSSDAGRRVKEMWEATTEEYSLQLYDQATDLNYSMNQEELCRSCFSAFE
jgi:hypothetical protein